MLVQNRGVRNSNWSMICTSSTVIIRSPSEIPLTVLLTGGELCLATPVQQTLTIESVKSVNVPFHYMIVPY